jgi:CRISPR/Cas system CMR-associated protein Cmr5 small subunit
VLSPKKSVETEQKSDENFTGHNQMRCQKLPQILILNGGRCKNEEEQTL